MKGILGRKIGMTQVYSNQGVSIPVTIIEIKPNVVTSVFTKEKDNYDAVQLGVEDVKKHLQKKPEIGHFKKSKTVPKKFVKEVRDMKGFEIGQKIDASLFSSGEFVDVIGISKGKGFAGAIKRHNQSIGPKSHGGGGGSQPVRQTGSIGDISGNKVFKGMTMPGQMGAKRRTQQNLEVIFVKPEENYLLVKGSIPGPKKGFVLVRSSIKLLKNKTPFEIVDLKEAARKNELIESAKKFGVDLNVEMSIIEMEKLIQEAEKTKEIEKEKQQELKNKDNVSNDKEKSNPESIQKEKPAEKASENPKNDSNLKDKEGNNG